MLSSSSQARASSRLILAICLLAAVLGAMAAGAQKKPVTLKQQLQFGVEMAQRGLWSEALFRFKQAEKMAPESGAVVKMC